MSRDEFPHNLEAEQSVLAALLLEPKALVKIATFLQPEDFYRQQHIIIYRAMQELAEQGKEADLVTLQAYLDNKGKLQDAGDLMYLFQLLNTMPTSANIVQHAQIVKAESIRRAMIRYGREVTCLAGNGEEADTQLEGAFTSLNKLLSQSNTKDFEGMEPMLESYFAELTNPDKGDYYTGIPTSYGKLDESLNGLQKGDFIILAARPSMGKTAMLMNMIYNILQCQKEYVVGVFSLEMSKKQLLQRLTCLMTGLDSQRLARRQLNQGEWDQVWATGEAMSKMQLFVDDTGGLTVAAVRNRARRLKAERGLDIIFIDYVQLMAGPENCKDRLEAVTEISRSLKSLARELDVPIVALAQLSRGVEGRGDKRPMLSDIRESGSWEQDADVVMFLYRDEYYTHEESIEPGVTELIIAKHRNGPVGTVKFYFEKECMRFVELF